MSCTTSWPSKQVSSRPAVPQVSLAKTAHHCQACFPPSTQTHLFKPGGRAVQAWISLFLQGSKATNTWASWFEALCWLEGTRPWKCPGPKPLVPGVTLVCRKAPRGLGVLR